MLIKDLRPVTMGVELEFEGLSPSAFDPLRRDFKFRVHNDGSVRTKTYHLDGLPVVPTVRSRKPIDSEDRHIVPSGARLEHHGFGAELVTEAYPYEDLRRHMEKVADYFGYIRQTDVTSIHIHVDAANLPWTTIQRVCRWAYALEGVLFKLAAGGGQHRGSRNSNNYRFCRPLSRSILVKNHAAEWIPLIDTVKLLNAKTATEFYRAWGYVHLFAEHHYVPHRLHCVSLHSLVRQGTIEWRLFDAVYRLVPDFMDLVRWIHELAEQGVDPPEGLFIPLGSSASRETIEEVLGLDLSRLWGSESLWPAPANPQRHHYQADIRIPMPELAKMLVHNNSGERDTLKGDFVLYKRGFRAARIDDDDDYRGDDDDDDEE